MVTFSDSRDVSLLGDCEVAFPLRLLAGYTAGACKRRPASKGSRLEDVGTWAERDYITIKLLNESDILCFPRVKTLDLRFEMTLTVDCLSCEAE